jgi:hypothetical protein
MNILHPSLWDLFPRSFKQLRSQVASKEANGVPVQPAIPWLLREMLGSLGRVGTEVAKCAWHMGLRNAYVYRIYIYYIIYYIYIILYIHIHMYKGVHICIYVLHGCGTFFGGMWEKWSAFARYAFQRQSTSWSFFWRTWGQERSSEVMHALGKKREYKEDHPCHFLVIQNSYDKITNCDG